MSQKQRNFDYIDRNILSLKSKINESEATIMANLIAKQNQPFTTPNQQPKTETKSTQNLTASTNTKSIAPFNEIHRFLNNINQLNKALQEKCSELELDFSEKKTSFEKQKKQLQREIEMSQQESVKLKETIKLNKEEGQKRNEIIAGLKQVITELKQEILSFKADHKILLEHIDRLQKQQKKPASTLEDRQLRVIRSLYQQNLHHELEEGIKKHEVASSLTNKIRLDNVTDRNADLKSLLRRQNEELELLRKQKQILALDNEQKYLHLQNQRNVVALKSEEMEKMNGVIMKMGEKIISLECIVQTYKESLMKYQDDGFHSANSYYTQTKVKAGSLYHKK